jgi:hypothetical protein
VPVPLVSGREWEDLPGNREVIDPARSRLRWLRDRDDHAYLTMFKRPPAEAALREIYSIALDRVGYVLGESLDLPVVPVHLESVAGEPGALVLDLRNQCSWLQFEKERKQGRLANTEIIPLCVAFDIWLANYDRAKKNILLQPQPPELAWESCPNYRLVLIDYGQAGLWPVAKMGLEKDEVPEAAQVRLDGKTVREALIVDRMPGAYWSAYRGLVAADREAINARIRAISDDLIVATLEEVPEPFMTAGERDRTIELLKARRDRVDDLARGLLE